MCRTWRNCYAQRIRCRPDLCGLCEPRQDDSRAPSVGRRASRAVATSALFDTNLAVDPIGPVEILLKKVVTRREVRGVRLAVV